MRSDARRNRDSLLDAARLLFAERGSDVPLEDVAQAAGVSRTTLYRHFATREDLASAVYDESVSAIEARAAELREHPDGLTVLFDFVLEGQSSNRGTVHMLSGEELAWLNRISERTAAAFTPLIDEAKAAHLVFPDVVAGDIMLALAMAGGAFADDDAAGRERASGRVRMLLRRALFVTP